MGKRRLFSREFKTEAVRLVTERAVSVAQAAKDLGVHENVLGKWVRLFRSDAEQAFPGRGKMKPDDAELARLRRELARTKGSQYTSESFQRLLAELGITPLGASR